MDQKRDGDLSRKDKGNLMNQLLEQKKNSRRASLAVKYGHKWIVKTQATRDHKDHVALFHM